MKKRSAFTLIELVMVMVVFGIVAGIGADIVASLYENYLRTRAINRLQSQSEIVLDQIAKRLQYRIKNSVRASDDNGANWVALSSNAATKHFNTIEWIGISNESFLGKHNGISFVPGWSGLIDMNDTNTSHNTRTLSTPGSRLDFANEIIKALTDNTVAMDGTAGTQRPALFFKGVKAGIFTNYYVNATNVANKPYGRRVRCVGNDCTTYPDILQLHSNNAVDDLIDYNSDGNPNVYEQYYLSHSAYTLNLVNTGVNDFNLTLRFNYQPWEGETYGNGTEAVLAENVSTFRIRQDGDVIRIKLCIHDNNQSGDFDFSACKEKVIY